MDTEQAHPDVIEMGATLSKLWGSLRAAIAGGGGPEKSNAVNGNTNKNVDLERGIATTDSTPSQTTAQPIMGEIKKYEITEVCSKNGS